MRRIIASAVLAAASLGGSLVVFTPAAHADSCVSVHLNVNGQDVVNQTQCLPGA